MEEKRNAEGYSLTPKREKAAPVSFPLKIYAVTFVSSWTPWAPLPTQSPGGPGSAQLTCP